MKLLASSFQWMIFMVAGAIAAPIAIAALFQLDAAETAGFVQRSMLVLGVAGMIQVTLGHKLPINEGPAGLWWGVFTIYATFVGVLYATPTETLQVLQTGLLISGVLFIVLAATGVITWITRLFTPAVTFTYLMLLVFQLSGSFLNGMLGLPNESETVRMPVLGLSLAVILLTFYLQGHRIALVQRYSIVLAIGAGWGLFALFGYAPTERSTGGWIALPDWFAFGAPVIEPGVIVTAVFITFLLTANMIASIRVMEGVMASHFHEKKQARYRQAGFAAGVNTLFSGAAAAIGPVPIAGAAGYVVSTNSPSRKAFFYGSLLVALVSLLPFLINSLALIPPPVAYAVTFVIFTKMVRLAFMEWKKEDNEERGLLVVGLAWMVGVGLMFVPSAAYAGLPVAVSSILSNGLITGTVVAVIVEQILKWKEKKTSR